MEKSPDKVGATSYLTDLTSLVASIVHTREARGSLAVAQLSNLSRSLTTPACKVSFAHIRRLGRSGSIPRSDKMCRQLQQKAARGFNELVALTPVQYRLLRKSRARILRCRRLKGCLASTSDEIGLYGMTANSAPASSANGFRQRRIFWPDMREVVTSSASTAASRARSGPGTMPFGAPPVGTPRSRAPLEEEGVGIPPISVRMISGPLGDNRPHRRAHRRRQAARGGPGTMPFGAPPDEGVGVTVERIDGGKLHERARRAQGRRASIDIPDLVRLISRPLPARGWNTTTSRSTR